MTRFACTLGAMLLLASANLRADNWPHWRGPENNGVAATSTLPITWSESKNIAWKLPLPGKAGSTPIIWGDRIFLTSSRKNDFVLLCIRTDGKPLWERSLAKGVDLASKKDEGNEGAASPSTDGKHIYTFHWSGAVASHDFEGREVWKFNAQERYGRFDILHGVHSTPNSTLQLIASPVATPGLLLVPTAKGGPVVAVKPGAKGLLQTGHSSELWRIAKGSPDVPSPLVHAGLVFLVKEPGLLHCLDARTGAELYLERLHADRYCASPIVAAGRIYVVGHGGKCSWQPPREHQVAASDSASVRTALLPHSSAPPSAPCQTPHAVPAGHSARSD